MEIVISIDQKDYTYGDLAFIEDYAHGSLADLFVEGSTPSIRTALALAYVTAKRMQPQLTIQELENMPAGELTITMASESVAPELVGGGDVA